MTENTARPHLAPVDDYEPEHDGAEVIAERAVLGTAVRSCDGAAEALAALRPEYFSRAAHRVVFEALERLADSGWRPGPKDGPTAWTQAVMGNLAAAGLLAKIGAPGLGSGGAFLHSLMQHAGSIAYHAPAVIAAAQQRAVRVALASAMQIGDSAGFDPDVHLDQIRQLVEDATTYTGPTALRPNSETVLRVLEALENEAPPGLPTGYPDLDDAIGALRPGELIIVGARPGMGKSLMGLCIADHIAGHVASHAGVPVLFASLEMTEEELTHRRIAAAAEVPLHHIVRHQVSDGEWERISRAHGHGSLTDTRLYVDDTSRASLAHIRGRLRTMARTGNEAKLVVIDYLGYLAEPKAESRQQAVAALARGAKILAREFSIPVLLLAQLNRGPETRSDKTPTSADLRESGEIEQSADIIILLHREDAYERESPRAGEIDLLITKNRQGPLTTVTLLFQGHYGRVVSMGPREWSPSSNASDS